jgi:lipopolysaccharide transport system ATP-binding protein
MHRIALISDTEDPYSPIAMETPFRIVIEYWNLIHDTKLLLNLYLLAADGTPIFESLTTEEPDWFGHPHPTGLFRSTCFVPGDLLNEGVFTVKIMFFNDRLFKLFEFAEAASISVRDTASRNFSGYGRYDGYVRPRLSWSTQLISKSECLNAAVAKHSN